MGLFVFEAIVESKRPSVQPQEGQPEPAALGRPSGYFGVKAARRRARADARAVGALPSRALDTKTLIKQFIQSFGAVGDLQRCVSLFLEPSAAAAKFAPKLSAQPALVHVPGSAGGDVRRRLDRLRLYPVVCCRGGRAGQRASVIGR